MPLLVSLDGTITSTPLTVRERSVLCLIARGLTQKQIAQQLSINMETVKTHIRNAYRKLDAHNKVDALRKSGIW